MKKMNKVIAAMMMMAITFAMPAMADNRNHATGQYRGNDLEVNNHKKDAHFDKADKQTVHYDSHGKHAYRPDVKIITIKVSRHDSHHKAVAKAEHIKGVMNTKWDARTRELTILYDANMTSARRIKHSMA